VKILDTANTKLAFNFDYKIAAVCIDLRRRFRNISCKWAVISSAFATDAYRQWSQTVAPRVSQSAAATTIGYPAESYTEFASTVDAAHRCTLYRASFVICWVGVRAVWWWPLIWRDEIWRRMAWKFDRRWSPACLRIRITACVSFYFQCHKQLRK